MRRHFESLNARESFAGLGGDTMLEPRVPVWVESAVFEPIVLGCAESAVLEPRVPS